MCQCRVIAICALVLCQWWSTIVLADTPKPPLPSPPADSGELTAQAAHPARFQNMAEALAFYNDLVRAGNWSPLAPGPLLREGDEHQQVAHLRHLLNLTGDYREQPLTESARKLFDPPLSQALMRFQRRHGATHVDGVLGPETRRLLNVPPWFRADQLILNMARQEALSAVSGQRYVQVNIPDYRLWLMDGGTVQLQMKAIVGRKSRPTPVFSSRLDTLVVNPAWSVPKSIAMRDYLPRWRRDPTYLAKHNLKVLAGWQMPPVVVSESEIDMGKMYRGRDYYRLWQPPGPGNALGRVKFNVPDSDSIYLHDTNSRGLFDADRRAFSSGCIRLEKPLALARWLLAQEPQSAPDQLDRLLASAHTRHVPLDNQVALHVTYWTAWLDESGVLNFRDDLYQRDERLLRANTSRHTRKD